MKKMWATGLAGNAVAFFYNTADDEAVTSGFVPLGRILADLSRLAGLDSSESVVIERLAPWNKERPHRVAGKGPNRGMPLESKIRRKTGPIF